MADEPKDLKDTNVIAAAVEARKQAEEEALKADGKKDNPTPPAFIRSCLDANERGDGALYAFLQHDHFVYNKTLQKWLIWGGHHWEFDLMNNSMREVESVVHAYLSESGNLETAIQDARAKEETDKADILKALKKKYIQRVHRLRSAAGANTCLLWSHCVEDALACREEDFDRDPWLLGCRNGVVELKTGRFRDGLPGDFITKAAPHSWTGFDTPAPNWENFLNTVFAADEELAAYVRRLFGYAITGLATEHILPVLYGEGRNGKSTFVETLKFVLGPLAQPIQSEMLLDQKYSRSSSGPSPDIMSLKGLRIAFASETDEGKRFSPARAKWLSGGDTLTGRAPHAPQETVFDPTHLLCFLTNHLPHAPGDDFAFWQRIHLVPFKLKFTDDPQAPDERQRDKELPAQIRSEASGILAWLVRGCIEWQRQGLNPPAVVRSATEQYRASEDTLAEFIADSAMPPEETSPDDRTSFTEAYKAFEAWFVQQIGDIKFCPKKKRFGLLMEKKFRRMKLGGTNWFYGFSLKSDLD